MRLLLKRRSGVRDSLGRRPSCDLFPASSLGLVAFLYFPWESNNLAFCVAFPEEPLPRGEERI